MFSKPRILLAAALAFGAATAAVAQEAVPVPAPDMPVIDAGAQQQIVPATPSAETVSPAEAAPAKQATKAGKKKTKKHASKTKKSSKKHAKKSKKKAASHA